MLYCIVCIQADWQPTIEQIACDSFFDILEIEYELLRLNPKDGYYTYSTCRGLSSWGFKVVAVSLNSQVGITKYSNADVS